MIYRESASFSSKGGMVSFHNATDAVRQAVKNSGVQNGLVSVYSHHTTCSIITQEAAFDMSMTGLETLQQDFVEVFEALIPVQRKEGMYLHPGEKALQFAQEHGEDARGCHNTDAHLRSALVGRSETFPVIDGEIDLGDFGYIYFIDFDQTRARTRTVQITAIGE